MAQGLSPVRPPAGRRLGHVRGRPDASEMHGSWRTYVRVGALETMTT